MHTVYVCTLYVHCIYIVCTCYMCIVCTLYCVHCIVCTLYILYAHTLNMKLYAYIYNSLSNKQSLFQVKAGLKDGLGRAFYLRTGIKKGRNSVHQHACDAGEILERIKKRVYSLRDQASIQRFATTSTLTIFSSIHLLNWRLKFNYCF